MRSITISGSIKVNNAFGVVGLAPVAVPGALLADEAAASHTVLLGPSVFSLLTEQLRRQPVPATRSAPFLRHRRRSHRSPFDM